MKQLNDLDLTQCQLLNAVLHSGVIGTPPAAPVDGQLFYDNVSKTIYIYDGTSWVDVTGDIKAVTANALTSGINVVSGTNGTVVLNLVFDNITIEVDVATNKLRVKAGGISSTELATDSVIAAKIAANAVTTAKILDANVTTAKIAAKNITTALVADSAIDTLQIAANAVKTAQIADANVTLAKIVNTGAWKLLGNASASAAAPAEVPIAPDVNLGTATPLDTNIPTQKAVKTYVDNAIATVNASISAVGTLKGAFVAGTANLPGTGTAATKAGDYWYVTGSGTSQGLILNPGDMLIANKASASPTAAGDYIALESNRDAASETVFGWVKLSTQAQVTAGTDDTTAVTPLKLRTEINAQFTAHDVPDATEAIKGKAQVATQAEVVTGTIDTDMVTPLKLRQELTRYIVQATEAVFGWLKIANQTQVNTGTDDATAVSPLKLMTLINARTVIYNLPATAAGVPIVLTPAHGLGTANLSVDVYSYIGEKVMVDYVIGQSAPYTITVTFKRAILVFTAGTSGYFVVVKR